MVKPSLTKLEAKNEVSFNSFLSASSLSWLSIFFGFSNLDFSDRFSFFNLYSISFFLDAKTWIALSLASFVIHAPLCHVRPRHTKASLVDEQLLDEKSTVTGLEQSRLGSVSAWTAGVEPDRSHMRVWERQSFRFDTVKASMSAVSESALRVCCQAERGESV